MFYDDLLKWKKKLQSKHLIVKAFLPCEDLLCIFLE